MVARYIAVIALALCAGCSTILAVKDQQRRSDANAVLGGTVATVRPARGPLVVGLFARGAAEYELVDYFTAVEAGTWVFGVRPGTYWIVAFEDVNGDGAYQDEPYYRADPAHPVVLGSGDRKTDVTIVIPETGRAPRDGRFVLTDMMARSADEQRTKSLYALSAVGKVTTLADPRFAPDVGQQAMWKYYDFIENGEPGIYFLEPYDPARIPVLFVHGIGGTPRDFTALVESLDRKHFQAWAAYYPTGGRLDVTVPWFDQLFTRLEVELGFRRAIVVAHSMGGLVSRGLVLAHDARDSRHVLRGLVTISSPLGGMASAGAGVDQSPIVVRSWYGLAPGREFLEGLFYTEPKTHRRRRRLPATVAYHMMFGFKGCSSEGASDGTVMLSSQLRPEAQEEARTIRGFDETHVGILSSPAAAAHLGEILATMR